MTPDQRFSVILTVLAAVLSGLVVLLRALFRVSQQWIKTGDTLSHLSTEIADLLAMKEREHGKLETRDDRLEARLDRHEQWHADHPPTFNK